MFPIKTLQNTPPFWNRSVPGFAFDNVTAVMMDTGSRTYWMRVEYKGPGKIGYYFEYTCKNSTAVYAVKANAVAPRSEGFI